VITCAPNFPAGKVYEGYKNSIWQQEEVAGIRVVRVWTYMTANEGFLKRSLDYMSFMVSGFLAGLFVKKVDVIIGTSPQFFTVCAAFMLSMVKRLPWVFELRDIWPESIRAVGASSSSKLFNILELLELFLYRRANTIIVVTNAFKDKLVQRGIDQKKIYVVTNGVDLTSFTPRPKDSDLISQYNLGNKFVVGFIGTHGMAHGLEVILEAAKKLKEVGQEDRFRFILIGDGAKKSMLVNRVISEGIDNIIFIDSVSKSEVTRYWSMLDTSIIHLKKTELFKTVIPSKMFESMGMAIPILHGVEGESAEIIKRENVGLAFEPENSDQLIQSLYRLADDQVLYHRLKENGPVAARRYDRAALATKMLRVLEFANQKQKYKF
jgi:glycosyltransferase involved in cell wall biosynthesis